MSERIQKLLATAGIASRRAIETLIAEGRVTVNGRPADVGQRINHDDHVRVDGRLIPLSRKTEAAQVLLYRKKVGELVTRDDPEGRKTVFRKLPELEQGRWIAVGRLDINTSGLLLLTNDGELARRLMHPSFEMRREYAVRVLGTVDAGVLARLKAGVDLEDGFARFETIEAGANNATLGEDMDGPANSWWTVTVKQGRNRVVRRLLESQNLQVSRLMRVSYGPIALGRGIKSGSYREATAEELQALLEAVQLQAVKPAKSPRKATRTDESDIESDDGGKTRRRHLFRDLDDPKAPERRRTQKPDRAGDARAPSRAAADRSPTRPAKAAAERGTAARAGRSEPTKPRPLVAQPTPREARFPLPAEVSQREPQSAQDGAYKPRGDRSAAARPAAPSAGRPFVRKDAESPSRRSAPSRASSTDRPSADRPLVRKDAGSSARRSASPQRASSTDRFSKPAERPQADGKPRSAKPSFDKRDFARPDVKNRPGASGKPGSRSDSRSGTQAGTPSAPRPGGRPDSRGPAKGGRGGASGSGSRKPGGKPGGGRPKR